MATIALFLALLGCLPQSSGSTSPDPRLGQAKSLLQSGKLSQAREIYHSILSLDPANAEAQQGMVDASERLALDARADGDSNAALRLLLTAQPFAPANPKLLYDLAVLEDSMSLYADADRTVTKLQALSGFDDPKLLYLSARVKLDLGQLEAAEKQMRAYLRTSPDDASAHYGLGRILQLGQQLDQAKVEFLHSLEIHPQQTESYYQLGEVALAQARYDDAIHSFADTLAGSPSHGGALTGTGIALYRLQQYGRAVEVLEKAVATTPEYRPAHYYLGLSLDRLGRKAEAARELARAAELAAADTLRDAQHLRITQLPADAGSGPMQPQ